MICTGAGCDRTTKCGRYYGNPQPEHRKYDNLEDLSTHGYGGINCESHYDCGPYGGYAMFEPLSDQFWYDKIAADFNSLGCHSITAEHIKAMIEQFKENRHE